MNILSVFTSGLRFIEYLFNKIIVYNKIVLKGKFNLPTLTKDFDGDLVFHHND